ncbi:MAG: DUF1648 domain-containing protein [Blastocatellales bacterium]
MTAKTRHALTYLPWLSLPFVLISYLILWNRLPGKLAVHFDSSGAANGWMSRSESLAFSLASLLIILLVSTMKIRHRREQRYDLRPGDVLRHVASVMAVTIIVMGVLIYNLWH